MIIDFMFQFYISPASFDLKSFNFGIFVISCNNIRERNTKCLIYWRRFM